MLGIVDNINIVSENRLMDFDCSARQLAKNKRPCHGSGRTFMRTVFVLTMVAMASSFQHAPPPVERKERLIIVCTEAGDVVKRTNHTDIEDYDRHYCDQWSSYARTANKKQWPGLLRLIWRRWFSRS